MGLGPTATIVDFAGNPISSQLNPSPNGNFNPLFSILKDGAGNTFGTPGNPFSVVVNSSPGVVIVTAETDVVAAAAGTCSLPAVAGKTTYLRGFTVSSPAQASPTTGQITITGLPVTLKYYFEQSSTNAESFINVYFGESGIPASAVNTPIVLNFPAIVAGTVASIDMWGYQL